MLDISQFRTLIIQPALDAIVQYSVDVEELLVATCAQESLGGTFLRQRGGGPAKGIYQMETRTHDDLWQTILVRDQSTAWKIMKGLNTATKPSSDLMIRDMFYATQMARVFYMRINHPIPKADDIESIWEYYKQFWNTASGAATKTQFITNYNRFLQKGAKKEKEPSNV